MNSSYLGKKRVFNIGTGFQYQKDAMNYRNSATEIARRYSALQQLGVDVFYEVTSTKQNKMQSPLVPLF